MVSFFDRNVLEQTSFDSALPTGNATIVHRFDKPGRFSVAMSPDGTKVVNTRTVYVEHPPSPDAAKRAAGQPALAPPRPGQESGPAVAVAFDIGARHLDTAAGPGPEAGGLLVGGYASFTALTGGAHHVLVHRVTPEGEQVPEFDSRRLGRTDTFAFTALRPGTYAITNALTGHEGRLVVTYPEVRPVPYLPPAPVTVTSGSGGFEPNEVRVGTAQGVIFHVEADSRIVVELVEPDDGPVDRVRRPVASRRRRLPPDRGKVR